MTAPLRLTPPLLLKAYAAGIFPMGEDDGEVFWIEPRERGILPLDAPHIPRRLRKVIRGGTFELRVDTAFAEVVAGCAAPGRDRPSTWINTEIASVFTELHTLGHAHSVEAWMDGELAGGLYGLALGGAFFGESMFSRVTDASKVALIALMAHLVACGFVLLDTQFVTDHLIRFGAVEIPRAEYRKRLARALAVEAVFQPGLPADPLSVLQSISQTS